MFLCLGIAILGSCFPFPGLELSAYYDAGWGLPGPVYHHDDKQNLSIGRTTVNQTKFYFGIVYDKLAINHVILVQLSTLQRQYIKEWIEKRCIMQGDIYECSIREQKFQAMNCSSAWLFEKKFEEKTIKDKKECDHMFKSIIDMTLPTKHE